VIQRIIGILIARGLLNEAQEIWELWNKTVAQRPAEPLRRFDPFEGDPLADECSWDRLCSAPVGCRCGGQHAWHE
jgi:hypothetical protein